MKKNLIHVSQLTHDHNVVVEFHSDVCFIKDKAFERVLLRGHLKDGLHRLTPTPCSAVSSTFAQSLASSCVSSAFPSLTTCNKHDSGK